MSNQKITFNQRLEIEKYLGEKLSYREIGKLLGLNYRTIHAEVTRNGGKKIYDPEQADLNSFLASQRSKYHIRKLKIDQDSELKARILDFLKELEYTPEIMVGKAKQDGKPLNITHPTIYSYIESKETSWRQYLPYKSKKKYRPRKRVKTKASLSKINISNRPESANSRSELQHYEIDTIHLDKGAILSMVDRKSRFLATALLPNRTAEATTNALKECIYELAKQAGKIKSITLDNGTEFSRFKEISDCFDIPFYHCDPYASYQRGSSENINRILRRYFPKKGNSFLTISPTYLQQVTKMINSTPRKILNYYTPYQVLLNSVHFLL